MTSDRVIENITDYGEINISPYLGCGIYIHFLGLVSRHCYHLSICGEMVSIF